MLSPQILSHYHSSKNDSPLKFVPKELQKPQTLLGVD